MAIGKRLSDLLQLRGENVNSLSGRIGVSAQTIYSIIKRDNMKVDFDVLMRVSKALDVPVEYFYEPVGKVSTLSPKLRFPAHYNDLFPEQKQTADRIFDETVKALYDQQQAGQQLSNEDNIIDLSISQQSFSAGHGTYLGPEAFEDIKVLRNELTLKADYGGPVAGDSMEPEYHDEDILLVSTKEYPELGEIGIFTLDGCGYVKELGDGELISLNHKYDPIPLDDSIHCNGKVIGILDPDWIIER